VAAPDDVDDAIVAYLRGAAQSNSGIAGPIADALAEGLRAKIGERAKFNNIMNQIVANEGYVHGIRLGKTFGVPLDKIMPYPGYGSVANINVGGTTAPAAPAAPPAPQPESKAAEPQKSKSNWLPWAISAGLLAGGTGLGGYLLANKSTQPPAIEQPSGPEIDPSVGIQIDG